MMTDLTAQIHMFLREAGFDVTAANPPFSFVAQNSDILVFVVETNHDIDNSVKTVTTLLSSPFRSKRFGPKTMEMYCLFAADEGTPISTIERWEQDLKFCRKVFVTNISQIPSRLSFLQQLGNALTASIDIDAMFWSQMGTQLSPDGMMLLKSLATRYKTTDELLKLLADKK